MENKGADCVFCRIIAGEIPARILLETSDFVVFHDINPKAPVHVLIVPRKHITNVNLIDSSDLSTFGHVFEVIKKAAKKMNVEQAYQIRVNNGEDAGQIVPHLHFHLMGGWKSKQKDSENL